jgi:hypothetical protein
VVCWSELVFVGLLTERFTHLVTMAMLPGAAHSFTSAVTSSSAQVERMVEHQKCCLRRPIVVDIQQNSHQHLVTSFCALQVEPLVKSYLGNSLHLLASMTQPEMSAYTLRRLRPSAAFFGPYPRLTKKLLKLGLELFGSGEKENAPRLQVKIHC